MTDKLVVLTEIDRRLASIQNIDEAKAIRDQAEAIRVYAKNAKKGLSVQNRAAAIKAQAEIRAGELLAKVERVRDRKKGGDGIRTTLVQIGIAPMTAHRWQTLAAELTPADVLKAEAKCDETDEELTSANLYAAAHRAILARAEVEKRKRRDVLAQDAPSNVVVIGDFREKFKDLPDACASLVLTDPPYDRKSAGLYSDIAGECARILSPGGSLITYAGQYLLPEILPAMAQHLRFWWILALHHEGGPLARMREYGIIVNWKPLLWFVKETRGDKNTYIDDLIANPMREKQHHDWQQGEAPASYLIEKLTKPGELVVDPMCGGGTTATAAAKAGRRFWACEIDATSAGIAAKRIESARRGLR